jgi:hypothetical protein
MRKRNDLESYKGLGKTNPLAAVFLSIFYFPLPEFLHLPDSGENTIFSFQLSRIITFGLQ